MSYLDDPRVFLATERTLLAWIRTEISILALVFLLKKYGIEDLDTKLFSPDTMINFICLTVTGLSILATIQAWLGLSKLGEPEVPSRLAKPLVLMSGIISIIICIGGSAIVMDLG